MADPAAPPFKLLHLRLAAAIAARGQLQQAAADLALSQPAASRLLAEAERMTGARLFERHAKGMTPTALGEALVRRARFVTAEMQELGREVGALRQGLAGVVRVGAITGPAVAFLVPALRRFHAVAPEAEVRVDVAPSTVLMRALETGELDFVIARTLPDTKREDLTIMPGRAETITFLARRGHPLDGGGPLTLAEIAGCDWVIQERGTPLRVAMEEAVTGAGLAFPRGIISTSSLLVTMAALAGTDAIAPAGEEVARLLVAPPVSAGFTCLRLARPLDLPFYHVISARGRSPSPAAQRLRALLLDEMARLPPG